MIDNSDRDNCICERFRKGETHQVIGDSYKISRERVRQILKINGIFGKDGGKKVSLFLNYDNTKRDVRRRKTLEKYLAKYKCTEGQFKLLRSFANTLYHTPIGQYNRQRTKAIRRCIGFQLTLWEWWCIWQDSGKYEQRGRHKGEYVMARIADSGCYSNENVEIIKCSQNIRDYIEVYGSNFHNSK